MTSTAGMPDQERENLEKIFRESGFNDFKWVDPQGIIVSQWVRMKCMFGCIEYGKNCCCPPNVPSVTECERFFHEYEEAVVFHFTKSLEKPEERHAWTKQINLGLSKLERDVFVAGYQKAFMLFMDSCSICSECAADRENCKQPRTARPGPEAMGVDVFATVRQYDFPIEVLSDYSQEMNRYSFLLVQ